MSSGGKRSGAGRPEQEIKRVTVTVRVLPTTKDTIQRMRAAGIKIGQVLDDAAAAWKESNASR